ncbi:MAG: glycosyltransferase [Spirulinaceae cyanobacterium]
MPTISVIIPAYNAEKTIQLTINSVLQQTWSDFEILVIDDGSNDSTLDKIATIADKRIKVLSQQNRGVSASRNLGISLAKGEYIAFLDADDLWQPNKLKEQLEALKNNPQAAVAYSWTDYIDESGSFLHPGEHKTLNGNVYQEILVHNFVENGSNPLIKKAALQEVGNFDECLAYGEDWELWTRLAAKYNFVVLPCTHILYRMGSNSASSNLVKMEKQGLEVIEKMFCNAPSSFGYLKRQSISNFYQYLLFRVLEGEMSRVKGIQAFKFLFKAWQSNFWLIKQRSKLISVVALKILAIVLIPKQQSKLKKLLKS